MRPLRSLCVFCGSSPGHDPAYTEAARRLGARLAQQNITLVFGAGTIGLMGAVATATLGHGGRVVGIIPEHLTRLETPFGTDLDLHIVPSMHDRKRMMFDRADAFCVLPGGIGTLDETIEILTWRQLGLHDKPVVLVNQNGFWDPLLALLRAVIDQGFAQPGLSDFVSVVPDVDAVVPRLRAILALPPDAASASA